MMIEKWVDSDPIKDLGVLVMLHILIWVFVTLAYSLCENSSSSPLIICATFNLHDIYMCFLKIIK